jgi:hypothetical protein
MVSKIRSFGDIPRDAIVTVIPTPEVRHYVPWSPDGQVVQTIGGCTSTLQDWLRARFRELVSERVLLEDISILHVGARTSIRVRGKVRFSFKLKVGYGE